MVTISVRTEIYRQLALNQHSHTVDQSKAFITSYVKLGNIKTHKLMDGESNLEESF